MSAKPERDTVIVKLRPHSRALFWPTLVLVVVVGGVGYVAGLAAEQWQLVVVLVIAALLVFTGWFMPLCRWLSRRYTITNRRVVVRSGFFVRTRQELLHSRAHDVTVRRGGLQIVFRSGDVILNSGQDAPVILKDVSSADLVQEALHDLIEAAQREQTGR
ncbi:membrane protein YdbS with pleckstrin-like domain [Salinibacterium sp. CAN_S4]|uniref:PH domain-containing protein n=1 Tax=Salinibacterium sp. CAN_S4 TaxID=2787727 RepID=UPI0018EF7AF4